MCLGLFNERTVKSGFFEDINLGISCSKYGSIMNILYLLVIAVFACDHQVKNVLILVKQNVVSRFHTVTPISVLKSTVGCLRSGSQPCSCTHNKSNI